VVNATDAILSNMRTTEFCANTLNLVTNRQMDWAGFLPPGLNLVGLS